MDILFSRIQIVSKEFVLINFNYIYIYIIKEIVQILEDIFFQSKEIVLRNFNLELIFGNYNYHKLVIFFDYFILKIKHFNDGGIFAKIYIKCDSRYNFYFI